LRIQINIGHESARPSMLRQAGSESFLTMCVLTSFSDMVRVPEPADAALRIKKGETASAMPCFQLR